MNRYFLEGIASDLASGAEIGVVTSGYQAAIIIMNDIMQYTDENYTQMRMSTGEIVHESGGKVRVFYQYQQARGHRFDTVVVPYFSSSEFISYIDPRAEIIGY